MPFEILVGFERKDKTRKVTKRQVIGYSVRNPEGHEVVTARFLSDKASCICIRQVL